MRPLPAALVGLVLCTACAEPSAPAGPLTFLGPEPARSQALLNFDADGHPLVRLDTEGRSIDAHDGEIERFGDLYYLYGTSYGCGFNWQVAGTPFCGFRVYSSPDLLEWTDRGLLFDPTGWQDRCGGDTYGCYRPHVVHDVARNRYVLWVNSFETGVGYHVFVSDTPAGPFTEQPLPSLAESAKTSPVNNGDENLFVDEDGTGYLVYTDWRVGGNLIVEKLTPDYLSGTGVHARLDVLGVEAPSLFRRGDRYYVTFSDPHCGFCTTGTSYMTAPRPLGPWSRPTRISDTSCGGQPTHVSTLEAADGSRTYLYQSDLWHAEFQRNQATAPQHWEPLEFTPDGEIRPLDCAPSAELPVPVHSDGGRVVRLECPRDGYVREARFTAPGDGWLRSITLLLYRSGSPDSAAGLTLEIRSGRRVLKRFRIAAAGLTWDARPLSLFTQLRVDGAARYSLRLVTERSAGCVGFATRPARPACPACSSTPRGTGAGAGARSRDWRSWPAWDSWPIRPRRPVSLTAGPLMLSWTADGVKPGVNEHWRPPGGDGARLRMLRRGGEELSAGARGGRPRGLAGRHPAGGAAGLSCRRRLSGGSGAVYIGGPSPQNPTRQQVRS